MMTYTSVRKKIATLIAARALIGCVLRYLCCFQPREARARIESRNAGVAAVNNNFYPFYR